MFSRFDAGFRTLSRKSIQQTLKGMGQRSLVSGVIQAVLYPAIMHNTPGMAGTHWMWGCTFILWAVCISRSLQLIYGPALLQRPNGIALWRIWFGLSSVGIALTWSMSASLAFLEFGMTPGSMTIAIICCGTAALYSASYPLDLPNNLGFQMLMMGPVILTLFLGLRADGAAALGLAGILFLVFSVNMALSLSKSLIQTLRNVEILEERDESLSKAHRELQANHELINAMLANIDQAFLILDFDGRCMNIASQRSRELLGTDPLGKGLAEILRLNDQQANETREWYSMLTADRVEFDTVRGLGPKMLRVAENHADIEINFHPLRSGDGRLYAVILTAFDITLELQAEAEIQAAKERAELIVRVIENRLGFRAMLMELDGAADRMSGWSGGDLAKLRMELHTLKGTANMFGALSVGRLIYEAEVGINESNVAEKGRVLRSSLAEWRERENELFTKLGVFEGHKIEVTAEKVRKLEATYGSGLMRDLMYSEFSELLKSFEGNVRFAAEKTGKLVEFSVAKPVAPLFVLPEAYREVLSTLVHMMNNSVDHGIESPEDRLKAGKPRAGRIRMSYREVQRQNRAMIELSVEDDGHGIDIAKVREKLRKMGRAGLDKLSELEIAAGIFEEGLSTSESVNQVSGQGIGMGAVRDAIHACGGDIEIKKTGPSGTVFLLHLPLVNAGAGAVAA